MYNLVEWYKEKTKYPLSKNGNYFDESSKVSFVYVIRNQANNIFKIGITKDIKTRKQQLRTQSGCDLDIVLLLELHYEYDESAEYIEKMLFEYFKECRHIGEWFKLTIKDLIQIRDLFYFVEGEDIKDNLRVLLKKN